MCFIIKVVTFSIVVDEKWSKKWYSKKPKTFTTEGSEEIIDLSVVFPFWCKSCVVLKIYSSNNLTIPLIKIVYFNIFKATGPFHCCISRQLI